MYKGNSVEIILPAYNESQTIKDYIKDLEKLKIFDKITAIDNNSSDNTKEEIEKTSAKYLFEKNQGFGAAVKGDWIIYHVIMWSLASPMDHFLQKMFIYYWNKSKIMTLFSPLEHIVI